MNAVNWFEHELRQYPPAELDLDALREVADRIVPAAGIESRGYPCFQATVELGGRLGREAAELPGATPERWPIPPSARTIWPSSERSPDQLLHRPLLR